MTNEKSISKVWVVDEASFISSKDMVRLLERQKLEGARIILIGDTRQLSAVEAGNPFLDLQKNVFQDRISELSESVRQKDKTLKEAVAIMNQGDIAGGLRHIDDKISEVKDHKRPLEVAKYFLGLSDEERDRSIVVARTNLERQEITAYIREGLRQEGKLGAAADADVYARKDLPREKLKIAAAHAVGDLFVPSKDSARLGLRKNEGYEIFQRDTIRNEIGLRDPVNPDKTIIIDLKTVDNFNVFSKARITIYEGDRLAWTRNQLAEQRINNDMFKVLSISGTMAEIRYDSGRQERIDLTKRHFMDQSLVLTTNKSQGMSRWRNIVSVDSGKHKEALYVDVTRAQGDIKIFCTEKEQLYKQAEVSGSNKVATSLLKDRSAVEERLRELFPDLYYDRAQATAKSSPKPGRQERSIRSDFYGEMAAEGIDMDESPDFDF